MSPCKVCRSLVEWRETVTDSDRDRLYAEPAEPGDFVFDAGVASVFPDMIKRSVPGYAAILNMITLLAGEYAQPDSRLYDLGCSLGAATQALLNGLPPGGYQIVAVDNAVPMLEKARAVVHDPDGCVEWVCADIREAQLQDASVVVLNFTLQFLPPADRYDFLVRIREALRPGGILILSEKIAGDDAESDRLLVEMHHAFKRANGYSELEVSQKRAALENVLIPEKVSTHFERLRDAGFSRSDLWFQCFNFVSLVART